MSLISFITVTDCDHCKKVEVSKDIEGHERYEAAWYDGMLVQFCPDCRYLSEVAEKIAQDINAKREAFRRARIAVNNRFNGRHEYAN